MNDDKKRAGKNRPHKIYRRKVKDAMGPMDKFELPEKPKPRKKKYNCGGKMKKYACGGKMKNKGGKMIEIIIAKKKK